MSIKVVVVDDSATLRRVMSDILSTHQNIEVIFTASDPLIALRKMEKDWPDVIVSDIEMPDMDGIEFLKKVMALRPTPFIICSTQAENLAARGIDALHLGALELIQKPQIGLSNFLNEQAKSIIDAVIGASTANLSPFRPHVSRLTTRQKSTQFAKPVELRFHTSGRYADKLIVIGSSTGGTLVLEEMLAVLQGSHLPPIVIVQHMPEKYTQSFAMRLNQNSRLKVMEAVDGQTIESGSVYIAPGGKHLELKQNGKRLITRITTGPPVSRHKPSVNVLFRSASKLLQTDTLGILLTGMGDDGAQCLMLLKNAGAYTVAQDKASSTVWGMPKVAWESGAARELLNINGIISLMSEFSLASKFKCQAIVKNRCQK